MHRAIAQVGNRETIVFDVEGAGRALLALTAPLLLAAGATTAAATFIQTGGVVAPGRIAPRFNRVDLTRGIGELFSSASAVATLRAVVYGLVTIAIVFFELRAHTLDFAHLAGRPEKLGPFVLAMTLKAWEKAALAGIGLAAVDLVTTRILWRRRLRMTKEEVAREQRETQGDPQINETRARAFQALMASSGNIDGAAIVVSDGHRMACALRYEAEEHAAPIVLAIGSDVIRLAEAREVHIEVDATLAAALTRLEIGSAIPEALFDDVADLLAAIRAPAREPAAGRNG